MMRRYFSERPLYSYAGAVMCWLGCLATVALGAGADPTRDYEAIVKELIAKDGSYNVANKIDYLDTETNGLPVAPLLPLLAHDSPRVRQGAAYALRLMQNRSQCATELLNAASREQNAGALGEMIKGLGAIGDPAATPLLSRVMTDHPISYVRYAAVEAEYWIKDARSVPALLCATEDTDSKVACRAVWVLGWIGDPKALPKIRAIAFKAQGNIQLLAVQVLGIMCDSHSRQDLLRMLDKADERLAVRIITSLGDMKCEQAIPRLERLASHKNTKIAAASHEALSEIVDLKALARFLERWVLEPTDRSFLVAVSNNRLLRWHFWKSLRLEERRLVPWEKAKELILKGDIVFVMQSHSLDVAMEGGNGVLYKTTEPKIDEVLRLIRQVDPKGVFINYGTE